MTLIKVHVLQVDQNPENLAELAAGVEVSGVQWIDPVDRKKVIRDCEFNGSVQSYQTVRDEIAANFLRSLGLLT